MYLQPFQPHELHLAYCYRLFLRFRTYRARKLTQLSGVDRRKLDSLVRPYNIRALQCASDSTDLMSILSLQPSESISSCASKLKGQLSKCLREQLQLTQPENLLSKGYFAITIGKSTAQAIARYLDNQAQHHGYDKRILPPVFVARYDGNQSDENRLATAHAAVVGRFHVVLSTRGRRGVFGSHAGEAIAARWLRLQEQWRIRLLKVSFVPDHVHLALRAHPSVPPLKIICELMNSAQETVPHAMVRAGIERLWLPSAYVGSYGDLADAQVRKYVENWRSKDKLL